MPEITDADREAAAHFLEYYAIHGWEKSVGNIRRGKADGSESVRAFAAHRESAYQAGLLAGAKAMQIAAAACPQNVRSMIGASDAQAMALSYAEAEICSLSPDGV